MLSRQRVSLDATVLSLRRRACGSRLPRSYSQKPLSAVWLGGGLALAAGDWEAVASVATEIERSFILKQSLTPEQGEILHSTLPPRFPGLAKASDH